MGLQQVIGKDFICAFGHYTGTVQHRNDSIGTGFHQVDDVLIVSDLDRGPRDCFSHVLLLLRLHHMLIEELLQSLIGEIDAKLLKRVVPHGALKAKDIQNADPQ